MEDNFKFEIVSPEKIIFSDNVNIATIPSYEGDMSILKNHISIITFLRPGVIRIKKKENYEEFFVQEGTVEYFNDNLVVLSTSAISVKNISQDFLENLKSSNQNKLEEKDITDQEKYIINHTLDAIKEIRI